jgi:hypothetical protein
VVALRRQAAVDGAGAHRHQRLAAGAELAQHVHVLGVAQPAFDQADVAAAQLLMSVSGERSNSTFSTSSSSARRCPGSDMWQPKQPASDTVATFSLRGGAAGAAAASSSLRRPVGPSARVEGRWPIGTAKPRRLGRITPTGQMRAARSSAVQSLSPSRPLALLTTRCVPMPWPPIANTALPSTSWLARTHSLHRMQRLKSSSSSGWLASTGRSG